MEKKSNDGEVTSDSFELLSKVREKHQVPKVSSFIKNGKISDIFQFNPKKVSLSFKSKAYLKARSLGVSLGLIDQNMKPNWSDSYHHTATSTVHLFEEMVNDAGFSFDDFIDPEEFCTMFGSISDEMVCKDAIKSWMITVKNLLLHPWVVLDMINFVYENLLMLPWDHILNWDVMRDFLHSIPKEDMYADMIPQLRSMICSIDMDGNLCEDLLPLITVEAVVDLVHNEFEMDLHQPIDFHHVIAKMVDAEDHMQEVMETVSAIQHEACYITTLEEAKMDVMWTSREGKILIKNVPICLSADYMEAHSDKPLMDVSPYGGDDGITMMVSLSDSDGTNPSDPMIPIEDPNSMFWFNKKKKNCKWLARVSPKKKDQLCKMNSAPEEFLNPFEACPSVCCFRPEIPEDSFSVNPRVVKTCEWLEKFKDKERVKKMCRFSKVVNGVGPAFVVCPETCGICPVKK